MEDGYLLRAAVRSDVPQLPDLQVRGGAAFGRLAMEDVANGPKPEVHAFEGALARGQLLVAVGDAGVVGFVAMRPLDGSLHVDQVTVDPAHVRRGIGHALMDEAERLARAQGFSTMTLTTFSDVPFNGPFYAAIGWQVIAAEDVSPGLFRQRAEERSAGLDRWPRQAMFKRLDAPVMTRGWAT